MLPVVAAVVVLLHILDRVKILWTTKYDWRLKTHSFFSWDTPDEYMLIFYHKDEEHFISINSWLYYWNSTYIYLSSSVIALSSDWRNSCYVLRLEITLHFLIFVFYDYDAGIISNIYPISSFFFFENMLCTYVDWMESYNYYPLSLGWRKSESFCHFIPGEGVGQLLALGKSMVVIILAHFLSMCGC